MSHFSSQIVVTIIFLSPHLDDIALSCGGYAHRLARQGERVIVATVCTADGPAGQALSPAAQHEHWQWQLGDQPYHLRRQEDERMVAALGAEPLHLGLLDAIYRHDTAGRPLYAGKDFMGGHVHEYDWQHQYPAVLEAIKPVLRPEGEPAPRVFCPLSAGGHVDHVIVRRAAEQVCEPGQIAYYEDYPYTQKNAAALTELLEQAGGMQAWRPVVIELTPEEIEARIAAIACYRSQLFAVFGDARGVAASMPARVREYVNRINGERYWERVFRESSQES
jgi:LmbE family N-acetylglucosaminyl deacetylase